MAILIAGLTAGSPSEHGGVFERDAVAADHVEASKAGAEVLAAGGNAADAAAATMLALGVVNPASSGIGGGGFALYYDAEQGSLTFLDFRERAPRASSPEMFEQRGERPAGPANAPSQLGGLAAGVPGEPAGIEALVHRFGKLPLRDVVAPALRLAERGFPVSEALARMGSAFDVQLANDTVMSKWDLQAGAVLKRPDLARVLRAFAQSGAAVIYGGVIGQEMVSSVRAKGGIMTMDDLYAYRVRKRQPIAADAFGYRWVTAPPPSAGGYTMLQSLSILERAVGENPEPGAPLLHAMAESWKGPYLDRQRYFGDPDFVIIPIERMMSPERLERRAELVETGRPQPAAAYDMPIEWDAPPCVRLGQYGHLAPLRRGRGRQRCIGDDDGESSVRRALHRRGHRDERRDGRFLAWRRPGQCVRPSRWSQEPSRPVEAPRFDDVADDRAARQRAGTVRRSIGW